MDSVGSLSPYLPVPVGLTLAGQPWGACLAGEQRISAPAKHGADSSCSTTLGELCEAHCAGGSHVVPAGASTAVASAACCQKTVGVRAMPTEEQLPTAQPVEIISNCPTAQLGLLCRTCRRTCFCCGSTQLPDAPNYQMHHAFCFQPGCQCGTHTVTPSGTLGGS